MNQTINISLPSNLNALAKRQVQTGYYSSVSEVVRDALRRLFLNSSSVHTIKMSEKAEKTFLQARKDHAEGKTILLKNVDDLDKLVK